VRYRLPTLAADLVRRQGDRDPQCLAALPAKAAITTEQWCCWIGRRRIISGSGEIAANRKNAC
jgi:hypothetical protein